MALSFKLCNLTGSTLPFCGFHKLSCRTPYSSFPFLIHPYNMAGTISKERVRLHFLVVRASLACATFSSSPSDDNMKFLPQGQFVMTSKMLFPLNVQPSTGSWVPVKAVLWCQSLLKQMEPPQKLPVTAVWCRDIAGLRSFVSQTQEP